MTDTFYKTSILDGALQKGRTEIVRALVAKGLPVSPRQLSMVVGGGDVPTPQAAISAKKDEAAAILRKAGAAESKSVEVSAEIPLPIEVAAESGVLKAQAQGQSQFTLSADSATEFTCAMAGVRMVPWEKSRWHTLRSRHPAPLRGG